MNDARRADSMAQLLTPAALMLDMLASLASDLPDAELVRIRELVARINATARGDVVVPDLADYVPCRACGWARPTAPASGAELPIVQGALDAQEAAERRAGEATGSTARPRGSASD